MRRNSISILKYLVLAALFLTLGPFLVKFMIPDDHDDIAPRGNAEGMPIEPGAVVRKSASDHEVSDPFALIQGSIMCSISVTREI